MDLIACQTGLAKHAPDLPARARAAGVIVTTVECFDKCETCERCVLVRIDGSMMRCGSLDDVLAAIAALRAA